VNLNLDVSKVSTKIILFRMTTVEFPSSLRKRGHYLPWFVTPCLKRKNGSGLDDQSPQGRFDLQLEKINCQVKLL
jgi:hypothetical protein